MPQVQLRMPEQTVKDLDHWVKEGRFKNRSDAIKTIVAIYEDRQKTMAFAHMLLQRSAEAKRHPERLVRLEDV